eukprot:TRINITY_DN34428_c0_g1_i1.p1 TRINITY_DN34428_c0_g1~~TRINITY_DN34428_c0_g1_i1.p1  ORF type:complete len:310 (-),score=27.06 TRINITY_DN34428_c0_g1_i1:365-1294(-)
MAAENEDRSKPSKWVRMSQQGLEEFYRTRPDDFRRRILRGIPADVRWEAWKAMLQIGSWRQRRSVGTIRTMKDMLDSDSVWRHLIELDAPRTFPDTLRFDMDYQRSLCRVLCAYANLNPSVGYCQGMSFIVGILLLVSGCREEEALEVFVCLMDDNGLSGFYSEGFPMLLTYQAAFEELVRQTFPDLNKHFDSETLQIQDFMHQWFLSLFVHCLPLPTVIVIWDLIMCDGLSALLTVGLTLLGSIRNILLTQSMADMITLLKSLKVCPSDHEATAAGRLLARRAVSRTLPEQRTRRPIEDLESRKHTVS